MAESVYTKFVLHEIRVFHERGAGDAADIWRLDRCFLHSPRVTDRPDGNTGGYSQINDGRETHDGPGNHSTQLASAGLVALFIRSPPAYATRADG